MVRGADISECGLYRYALWRIWQPEVPRVVFIGLNPSTADATTDDPTIRRCVRFAYDWGAGGVVMLNLFAFRANSPRIMMNAPEPVGIQNEKALEVWTTEAHTIVAAWGVHGTHRERDQIVAKRFHNLQCLGVTKNGFPRHPLYVRADTQPQPFPHI